MTIGGYNRDTARLIYRNARKKVDLMVKAGKLEVENADKEWAKIVTDQLEAAGAKVPKKILDMRE